MHNIAIVRGFVALAALVSIATVISAQAPTSPSRDGIPELLAEVRALRAEVNQAAGASMRMQLLLARLTLQEQRIASVGRQIGDIRAQLLSGQPERSEIQARLERVEEFRRAGSLPPDDLRGFEHEARMLNSKLSAYSTREQHLRSQEAELLATLAAEQGRWMEFNTRLDELERSLPAGSR